MKRCQSLTLRGTLCRCEATHGNYCEFHYRRPMPAGGVSEIVHESKELPTGEVRYEKSKKPWLRKWGRR